MSIAAWSLPAASRARSANRGSFISAIGSIALDARAGAGLLEHDIARKQQRNLRVEVEGAVREHRVARTEDLQRRALDTELRPQRRGDVHLGDDSEPLPGERVAHGALRVGDRQVDGRLDRVHAHASFRNMRSTSSSA